jgi:histidinol phosphatase-like enzyme (inositol monophosphatase family)
MIKSWAAAAFAGTALPGIPTAMTTPQPVLDRLEFGLDGARRASELILTHYRADHLAVERKRDSSPVTEADRGAEQLLRARILQAFPHDAVLGEEFGETPGTSGFRWILDPVDGTKSFIHGVPLFGTLIGLEHHGDPVMGICRLPALDEVVYAAAGGPAYRQSGLQPARCARVSAVQRLADATFCFTTVQGFERIGRADLFAKMVARAGLVRGWGDCYGHLLVATGQADIMIDPLMNVWDIAALIPILEAAGGACVDWQGRRRVDGGNGISVNAALKDEVLSILNDGL